MNHQIWQKAEKIKVSDFTILGELARLASIREVARVMRTTPAQISRRLNMIEKTLGYRIFERGPKGLILTGMGQDAMKFAILVSGEFPALLSHRKQKRSVVDRPLGVASTSFLLSHAAIPAIGELMKRIPEQRSYVLAFNPDDMSAAGIKGAFQIAVHPSQYDWPRSWQSDLVGQLRWSLWARKGHPYFRTKTALEEVPFCYPLMWDGAKLVMQNDNCPLPVSQRNAVLGTQTAEQAMHMIQNSDAIGFLPRLLMRDSSNRGSVVEIEMPDWPIIEQPIYMSFRTDAVTETQFLVFHEALRKVLSKDQ